MDINSTYFHSMSISRYSTTTDEWGKEVSEWNSVPALQLIPCALSQNNRNSTNTTQTESRNNILSNPKIFCNPNLDIRAGDRIEILFQGRYLGQYVSSMPYLYPTHQEIPLLLEGEA